ncbi:DMT family transporter [Aquamicrobium segne]|uniref:DMT family transporter n=1 Tax=Aquamicrobium segne TaxID=469547 RepID=A0ABW0H0W3_9HYPH
MALTIDIPLIKLANGDAWSILFVRSCMTITTGLIMWAIWRFFSENAPRLIPGRTGLIVAGLYGCSSILFILAVFNTTTADLVFILAFNAMFAALLSWVFLRERPRPQTLFAMALMVVGISIIVGSSLGTGNLFGNLIATCAAFVLASAITLSRASRKDMGFAALIGVILPCLVAGFMVSKTGLNIAQPGWIIFNGAVVIPISFFCLANGPKYITAPEVAMFYLLETVLAPVWVWMIFSEAPSRNSLIGGAILILTLICHSLWQLREGRRRGAALAIRHPA